MKKTAQILTILVTLVFASKVSAQTCNTGDGDGNGKVDGFDYVIWWQHFNQNINGAANGDFNCSGNVDGFDYVVWWSNFGTLLPTPTISPSPTASCLNQSGPLVTLKGVQSSRYDTRSNKLAQNTKVDARNATWIANWPVQDSFNYPVLIAGGPSICFSGGTIQGSYPDQIGTDANATWEYMHSTSAMKFSTANSTLENVRIHNYGDAIGLDYGPSDNFTIRGAHLSYIRDDCVENDWMFNILIDDSLFDGCYTGFSARSYSGQSPTPNGSNNVWTIRNSLVRLQPTWGVYKNRGLIPGHGGFFKWDSAGISPKLSLHNNVFRADQPANSESLGLGIPTDKLTSCSNNVMVWLGSGSFPDNLPATFNGQPCFTITKDRSVWDNAVAQWNARH